MFSAAEECDTKKIHKKVIVDHRHLIRFLYRTVAKKNILKRPIYKYCSCCDASVTTLDPTDLTGVTGLLDPEAKFLVPDWPGYVVDYRYCIGLSTISLRQILRIWPPADILRLHEQC
jgi:hypothetical protein